MSYKIKYRVAVKGYIECPFCNKKINASVMSSDGCDHLSYKDSQGNAKFVLFATDKEESNKDKK